MGKVSLYAAVVAVGLLGMGRVKACVVTSDPLALPRYLVDLSHMGIQDPSPFLAQPLLSPERVVEHVRHFAKVYEGARIRLDLSHNFLDYRTLKTLAVLGELPIDVLDLSYNRFKKSSIDTLKQAFSSAKYINLQGNWSGAEILCHTPASKEMAPHGDGVFHPIQREEEIKEYTKYNSFFQHPGVSRALEVDVPSYPELVSFTSVERLALTDCDRATFDKLLSNAETDPNASLEIATGLLLGTAPFCRQNPLKAKLWIRYGRYGIYRGHEIPLIPSPEIEGKALYLEGLQLLHGLGVSKDEEGACRKLRDAVTCGNEDAKSLLSALDPVPEAEENIA